MGSKRVFPDSFSLAGKVALVTGSGRGIGAAISVGLAEAGADLVLVSRTGRELEHIQQEIEALGQRALPVTADITREDDVINLFELVKREYKQLDILVNNAGTSTQAKAEEMDLKEWDQIIELNNRALFHVTQLAGRIMIAQQSGKIINMASHLGVVGLPRRTAYCMSKAAVIHYTRTLAAEWAGYGINVNCIAPGYTMTKLARQVLDNQEFRAEVLSKIPLGFIASPEDQVGAVIFLAAEASRYMTGQTLVIDGGWSCL